MRTAWAVVEDGKIDINTVYATRRGAIVNWLVQWSGDMVSAQTSDEEIEKRWGQWVDRRDSLICTTVNIEVTKR